MIDEKTKQIINNFLSHAQKYILEHKKDFSSWSTIYHRFIKKDKVDPAFNYTKEIIKRMEKDKVTSQTAMVISDTLLNEMKGFKKEIIIMALPMLVGLIMLTTFSILLGFSKPFSFSNHFVIYYLIGIFISLFMFGFGLLQRKKVKINTLSKTMLFQASAAYGASKLQGQGSFGAFRILEEMKLKQGKELQIQIKQPKIIYK